METSLVPTSNNPIYITHAEFQGCFIKIWATVYSKRRANLENSIQNYRTITELFTKLDLYGNTLYVYVWKTANHEERVYRCEILSTDLVKQTHSIKLIDYSRKLDVPYSDVREVVNDIDKSLLVSLSQVATEYSYLLTGFISKQKSNNELYRVLCNKYYKYRKDFDVSGITFVTLFDVDKSLIDSNLVSAIDIPATINIAHGMFSALNLSNISDTVNCSVSNKTSVLSSFPKHQYLDYTTVINVIITRVSCYKNTILLTVRTCENDSEVLINILNSVDRKNLKLASILEVHTPCLILLRNTLVRAIILEVENDRLLVDLIDYGVRESVPRTGVFEIPPNCYAIEMQSLNVVLDTPPNFKVDTSMFLRKCFQMLPVKIDPCFGLYKVKLFNKKDENLMDIHKSLGNTDVNTNGHCSSTSSRSPEFFSITEINDENKENLETDNYMSTLNHLDNFKIDNDNLESKEKENESPKDEKIADLTNQENPNSSEKEPEIHNIPITFLRKENLRNEKELMCSLIYFKSPFHFNVRKYNPNFERFMNQIKSDINSRYILKKHELTKNMYVIYQNQSGSIYRAQIIDLDIEVEMIKLQLVDEGNEITHHNFSNMTLFNFIESDCDLPGQLVLDCSLNNMWFPVINVDTLLLLQPYFNKELLYNVQIVTTIENGINLVEMAIEDSNVNISDLILKSGIGQRLCAVMKTDETPYEENLFVGQSFLSYVFFYVHCKLCVQPEPNTVDELEDEIQEYIKNNSNPEPLDVNYLQGTYCLATIDNTQWYRAHIRNIREDSIIVFMFDIGLLAELPSLNQIRPITYDLMKKPQLCLHCCLETKDLNILITEKTLFNVTVKSINNNGQLCVEINKHTAPLSNPIVRSLEKISFVHVDGDLTYLRRFQDNLNLEKMSKILSELDGKLENKTTIVPGGIGMFENCGKYYRCIVKSINSKMAVVHCIDYGFEMQVEKEKLQYLGHSKIALLPALVITVKTFPMAFDFSNTIFLASINMDEEGKLNISPNKMSSTNQPSKLIETLKSGCLVKVSYVNSSNACWIVPHMFLSNLEIISDTLVKMQSKFIPAVMEVGSLCAALHSETKKWHRALLLEKDAENQTTLSVDSGELFKALKTTKLASNIQKIPNCALRCQAVSNVDLEQLLNKDVKCKLIASDQTLLKVELFSEDLDKTEIVPTQPLVECVVVICRFESFNEFYVKEVDDANNTDIANANHQLTSVQSGNKSVGKLSYHCCLENNILDDCLYDPETVSNVLDLMMNFEWTMRTYSEKEPYKVTLTRNGVNCIDTVCKILFTDNNEVSCNSGSSIAGAVKKIPDDGNFGSIVVKNNIGDEFVEPSGESNLNDEFHECNLVVDDEFVEPLVEKNKPDVEFEERNLDDDEFVKPLVESKPDDEFVKSFVENSNITLNNNSDNNLISPDVESVTITHIVTFKDFYAHSESLHASCMQKINNDLDVCVVHLPLDHNLIGSVLVTFSLNGWCRAKIVQINSDCTSALCYLLDFGTYEDCTEFYTPTDFLNTCPPIVRHCSLYTPELVGKENEPWFYNVNDIFKDIASTESIKFNMSIVKDGDPCLVTLHIEDTNVSKMLIPLNVNVMHVESLVDFKVIAVSDDRKAVTEFLENDNTQMLLIEDPPVIGDFYLAKLKSKLRRVRFDEFGGSKYVVVDIDDTLHKFSVAKLYVLPENIRKIPIFTLHCSLIFKNVEEEHMYSLKEFQKMAAAKIDFTMCIITESNVSTIPHLVKLYIGDKDVRELIIKKYLA